MFRLVLQGLNQLAVLLALVCFSYSAVSETCSERFSSLTTNRFLSKKVEELGLNSRINKVLKDNGIKSLRHLFNLNKEDLMKLQGIGPQRADEIYKQIIKIKEEVASSEAESRPGLINRVSASLRELGENMVQTVAATRPGQAVIAGTKTAVESRAGQAVVAGAKTAVESRAGQAVVAGAKTAGQKTLDVAQSVRDRALSRNAKKEESVDKQPEKIEPAATAETVKPAEQTAEPAEQTAKPAEQTAEPAEQAAQKSQELQAEVIVPRQSLRDRVRAVGQSAVETVVTGAKTAVESRAGQAVIAGAKTVAATRPGQAVVAGAKTAGQKTLDAAQSVSARALSRNAKKEESVDKQPETIEPVATAETVKPAEQTAEPAEQAAQKSQELQAEVIVPRQSLRDRVRAVGQSAVETVVTGAKTAAESRAGQAVVAGAKTAGQKTLDAAQTVRDRALSRNAKKEEELSAGTSAYLERSIETLIDARTNKVLKDNGIESLRHLFDLSKEDLMKLKGIGSQRAGIISEKMINVKKVLARQDALFKPDNLLDRASAQARTVVQSAVETVVTGAKTAGQKTLDAAQTVRDRVLSRNAKKEEESADKQPETIEPETVKPAEQTAENPKKEEELSAGTSAYLERSIETLRLDARINKVLKDNGIESLRHLFSLSKEDLMKLKGIGPQRADIISENLDAAQTVRDRSLSRDAKEEDSSEGAAETKSASQADQSAVKGNVFVSSGVLSTDIQTVVNRMRTLEPYKLHHRGTIGLYNYAEQYHRGDIKKAYDEVGDIARDLRTQAEWNYKSAVQFKLSANKKITDFDFKQPTIISLKRNGIETVGQLFFAALSGNVIDYQDSDYNFDKIKGIDLINVHDQGMRNLNSLSFIGPGILSNIIEVMWSAEVHPIIKKLFTSIQPGPVESTVREALRAGRSAVDTTLNTLAETKPGQIAVTGAKTAVGSRAGQAVVAGVKKAGQKALGTAQNVSNRLLSRTTKEDESADRQPERIEQVTSAEETAKPAEETAKPAEQTTRQSSSSGNYNALTEIKQRRFPNQ